MNKREEISLQDMIEHCDAVESFCAQRGESYGMHRAMALKLRRLAELEDMIQRGELVRENGDAV